MPYDHKTVIDDMLNTLRTTAMLSAAVSDADLVSARHVIAQADSFGHILDPTAYRDALYSGSLDRQRAIVRLFADIRTRLKEIFPDDPVLASVGRERVED